MFREDGLQQSAGPADPRVRRCPGSGQPGQELLSSPCLPVPSPLHLLTTSQQPYQTQVTQYGAHGNSRVLHCPSIHITAINSHVEPSGIQGALDGALDTPGLGGLREVRGAGSGGLEQDWLSLEPCYRDMALSPSPCSSLSSRSCLSEVSSCESFSHVYDDVEVELEEAAGRFTLGSPLTSPLPSPGCGGGAFGVELWQQQYQHPSPCPSPRHSPCSSVTEESWLIQRPTSRTSSRPTSPCGKRRHAGATDVRARSPSPHYSPSPTPGHSPMSGHSPTPGHSPRGSVTEDSWQGGLLLYGGQELDVPSKTRRTSGSQPGQTAGQRDCGLEDLLPLLDTPGEELGNQEGLSELFLPVPSNFSWSTPAPRGPLFRSSSLPPLDWPLPSRCGPVELKLVSGPRPYHRAHYETEGSRGAIKAVAGGHPVVKLHGYAEQPLVLQVFIATAIEENILRPHAFYQVHRVTGKSVTTACQETLLDGTKVLEIPLLPEQNMSASIDCVGILKLRNADIELRKGETDLGRKNTRVRVVYRVNIPQHHGNVLCLQTASVPIECSQRLALELPQVEGFSPASSSMEGGEEMLIRGHNISTHSRVVFMEKGPEGRTHWEAEAELVTEKSRASVLVVKIPPYRSTKGAVPVHFYVSNGKKKRSQSYSFTYLNAEKQAFLCSEGTGDAPLVKQEGWDLDYISHNPRGLNPSDIQEASYSEVHIYKPCVGPGVYGTYPQTGSSPLHPHTPSYSGQQPCVVMTTAYPSAAALAYNNQSNPPLRCRNLVPDRANMDASAGGFVSESQSRVEVIQATPPSSQAGRGFWPSVPDSSTAPHPHSLFCQGEGPVWVKQEVEESVSLQDFTLDEVNEILDRDFFGLSDAAEPIQTDHNQNSSAAGVTFSSLLH